MELTWGEILRDTTRFPDDTPWTMPDGSQVTMGSLREAVVPQSEHQRTTRQTQQQLEAVLQEKRYLESQLAHRLTQPDQPLTAPGQIDYANDPLFAPLWKQQQEVAGRLGENEKLLVQMRQQNQQLQQHLLQQGIQAKLDTLAAKDPTLDRAALLDFAGQRQIGDLDAAYKVMNYDRAVARAAEEAAARTKAEMANHPQVPYAPVGGTGAEFVAPKPKFDTLDAAFDAALQDMEVYQVHQGQPQ